jgi:hypothetical protein
MLSICFGDSAVERSADVTCMVDLNDFGDMIGVEVLDWRRQLSGGRLDAPSAFGQVRWSYDDEIDAFYVQIMDGRGQVQRRAKGVAGIDGDQRVVRLDVPVPSHVT